jgi:excisionase family DNA binding protein
VSFDDEFVKELAERIAERLSSSNGDGADGFLDVDGAAAFLACPSSRIYALVSARRIPHHRDGSRLLFDRAELRDYVRRGGARRP